MKYPEPPTPTAQRQYILVGKVIQNLANGTLPGSKEDYMDRLNDFITSNQDDLQAFLDRILVSLPIPLLVHRLG